ncbi:uncharacterized protein DC041_0002731 [Schistosoma bovis]|uniref:Tetraspanin n=1 Tax=Schistosoma bovis TaxID=6184 RepID=A0A430QB71_SCHBO|nr:uncharacterized protein DC041_0002731 [Schistosoma bovis]
MKIFDLALLILPFRILTILSNYNMILDFFKPVVYPVIICSGFLGLLSIFIGFIGIWKKKNILICMHIIGLIIATIIEISISISSSVSNNQVSYYANDDDDDDALDDDDDDDALDDDDDDDDDDLHLTNSNQSLWNSLQYYQKHPIYENQFDNLQKDVYSIVLISLGIDKLNFLNRFTIILHNAIPIIIPMIISSGLLCLITALIGLIGLIKQKQCIALIHIGGLLISAIIEFSTATISAVSKDQFFMKVNSSLHESIIHYEMNYEIKNEFNNLQMTLGCCGASYFRDYLKIHSITPSSCKPTSYGFIFGIVLLALGIKGLETLNKFGTILNGIIPPIIPIAIFIGCLILIGTMIGYIGLWKPKKFIVILHIACLCLAVIIEIAIATATATTGEKVS